MQLFFKNILWIFLLAVSLRACVVETVRVSDDTMNSIARSGDLILVTKLSYGMRIPGSGAMMIQWQDLKKGDLVVLTDVGDPPQTLLRRIAAMPGESFKLPADARGTHEVRQLKYDEYAVLADAQENIPDSRSFGPVSRRAIIGKAKYIWLPSETRLKSLQ